MDSITNIIVAVLVVFGAGLFLLAITGIGKDVSGPNAAAASLQDNGSNFQKFVAAELPDKCKTPPGYSDADWKQHLGHHPDRYAECLN